MKTSLLALCVVCVSACSPAKLTGPSSSGSGASGTSAVSATSGTASSTGRSTSNSTGSSSTASTSTTTAGSSGSASSTTSGSSTGTTASGPGRIEIVVPLQLDAASYAPGASVRGTVTFGDPGTGPATFRQAVITLRPPGATHAGGPYDNLAPALGPTTLPPGGSVPLGATFTLPASGPAGQWEAYATYQDLQGAYADGPSVYFTFSASSTSTVTSSSGSGSTGSSGSGSTGSTTGSTGTTASSAPFTVVGNKIVDSLGRTHLFHGVARPSLEWDPAGNSLSLSDYQLMANDWRANTVRISLNQDYWLTGAGLYSPTYRATIAQSVAWAEQAGMDVILDLHWTDEGDLQLASNNQGQKPMADVNSIQFWSEVADVYKNDPHVLFELFNEPFDISWDVWLNGGATGGTSSFTAAGMQSLYNAVRATGANNLVVIGGLSWSADLTGVPTHRVVGNNIVYNTHIYDYPGTQKPTWDGLFGFLTATDPVIATEFGQYDCGTQFVTDFIGYADAHGMGWTSWAWFPRGCAFPSIIADWSGAPSAMGGPVKAALTSY